MPTLFSCGSNGSGQLAIGHSEDVAVFTRCVFDESCPDGEVVDVVSAASHTLLLIKNADGTILFGAGTNTHGQLGRDGSLKLGDVATSFRPLSIGREFDLGNYTPVKIAATWTTSFVVFQDSSGRNGPKIVATGSNDWGELGMAPSSAGHCIVDIPMEAGEQVELIRGGQRHIMAVLTQGSGSSRRQRLVGWGAARKGELDPASYQNPAKGKPTKTMTPTAFAINARSPIKDIRLGSAHTLALLEDGRVLAWGHNLKGQTTDLHQASGVRSIGATWGGSYIVSNNSLWSQGSNTHGQLVRTASSPERLRVPLDNVPDEVIAGSEHIMVIPASRTDIWTGGWNEHGNLGLGDLVDRPRLERVNLGSTVKRAWGGCAASWVLVDGDNEASRQ